MKRHRANDSDVTSQYKQRRWLADTEPGVSLLNYHTFFREIVIFEGFS